MFHGVCYLFGNREMPSIHGTVTFREDRKNYICVDIDIQGELGDFLYGIKVGKILFPPIAPDFDGNISITFCRKGEFDFLFSDLDVAFFRYDLCAPNAHVRRQNVALGRIHRVICGGKDYRETK